MGPAPPPLVLASGSPRRADVLEALGLSFAVDPAEIPEARREGESPQVFVERLSREKARTVAARHPRSLVLGGDTVVVLDDDVLSKPTDAQDAARMLRQLAGREHVVATGLALAGPHGVESGVDETRVRLRPFGEEAVAAYVASGEPMDKAGAYGIQGKGGALVRGVAGDYFTVMGFPIALFVDLLGRAGLRYAFGRLAVRSEPGDGL
jgi:septum formation protein